MLTLSLMRLMQSDALQEMKNARGVDPLPADQNVQLNWAYRIIARKCSLTIDTPLTLVQGQSSYKINGAAAATAAKIIRPKVVYINQLPLYDASGRDYGLWTFQELMNQYPAWKAATQGTPSKAVFFGHDTLIVHQPPDATAAAGTHSVYGIYLPNDLAADGDVPALPEEIHEAIPWLAAQLAVTPTLSEDAGYKRIEQYQTYWTQIIQDVADQNVRTLQSWGSTGGFYDADFIGM